MALFSEFKKKSILKSALKQMNKARQAEGNQADLLYSSAYQGFADVVKGDLLLGETLYNWGFALLHQGKTKTEEEGVKFYLEAISKFTFCLLVSPNHLGAAIDGGVAYMDLARIMGASGEDELYELAKEFFDNAERIQKGSASYNLACIASIQGQYEVCLEALEKSKTYGSLPDVEDVREDADLMNVKNMPWFSDFLSQWVVEPKPITEDDNQETFDAEGNVIKRNKTVKRFENEVDGVVYDAEGNILRKVDSESSSTAEEMDSHTEEKVNSEKTSKIVDAEQKTTEEST